jgi:hypothetical protein
VWRPAWIFSDLGFHFGNLSYFVQFGHEQNFN